MPGQLFHLEGRVSTNSPGPVRPVLSQLFPHGRVREEQGEFVVSADVEGESAKDLNRAILSTLRRTEKRTRLRAEWTDTDGTTYRFFDYVLKATRRP
jgi:hypothetical protein